MAASTALTYIGIGVVGGAVLVGSIFGAVKGVSHCKKRKRSKNGIHDSGVHIDVRHDGGSIGAPDDFEAEKKLIMNRVSAHRSVPHNEAMRSCLKDLQLHLAVEAANSSAFKRACATRIAGEGKTPALLAEIWFVHGQLYPEGVDEDYPALGGREVTHWST